MSAVRQPRSKLYDGMIYGRVLDPLLAGVHGFVTEKLPEGDRVLDACCGTGGLARRLAAAGRTVVGVDLSPRQIRYARAISEGVAFEVGDVSQLEPPEEGPYDVATIVLALHEMPAEARAPVLANLVEVAQTVMVVDFAVPMPRNLAGVRNRFMELVAGWEHFNAFRDYTRRGGLPTLVRETGVKVVSERRIDAGTLQVCILEKADATGASVG